MQAVGREEGRARRTCFSCTIVGLLNATRGVAARFCAALPLASAGLHLLASWLAIGGLQLR